MKSTPTRYQGEEAEDNSDDELAQSSRPLRLALRKGTYFNNRNNNRHCSYYTSNYIIVDYVLCILEQQERGFSTIYGRPHAGIVYNTATTC